MRDFITEKMLYFFVDNPTPGDFALPQVAATDDTVKGLLTVVFGLAATIAVLVIVIAGFTMVVSDGDPEKISRSKKAIIYALVGLLIAVSANIIMQVVLRGL